MSARVAAAKLCIAIAKRELERGWERRGSKEAEADAIACLAKAKEALLK